MDESNRIAREIRLSATAPAVNTLEDYCWDDAWRKINYIKHEINDVFEQALSFIEIAGVPPRYGRLS